MAKLTPASLIALLGAACQSPTTTATPEDLAARAGAGSVSITTTAPATGIHSGNVWYDCEQTDYCREHDASRAGVAFHEMAVQQCIANTSALLAKWTDGGRAKYTATVQRCDAFTACDYLECTQATPENPLRYSVLQKDMIVGVCSRSIACSIEKGARVASTAADDCFTQEVNSLEAQDPADRTAFEQRYAQCAPLYACAFVMCQDGKSN